MKKPFLTIIVVTSLLLWNMAAVAGPKEVLDRDCTAAKAARNTAMKATVSAGGPCGPADAAKDTAKEAVGLDEKKEKKKGLLKK
ncbi:MAG: hypothetical protein U9R57_10775 [Thermodesulfobacteriota bacterium]|nr:hypothetical protein [Thermodesulfobacteriota bacterium]